MRVYIDSRSTINYASYYIQGLYDYYGRKNVSFSSKYFSDLDSLGINIVLAFVTINDKGEIRRYIVDSRDQSDIIDGAYEWSDVYAKVNVNSSTFPELDSKGINITPSFAVKIWNPLDLILNLCSNFIKAKIYKNRTNPNIHIQPKIWIKNYLSLLNRQKLSDYMKKADKVDDDNYVFFISTLWNNATGLNLYRQKYALACVKNQDVKFAGGFFAKNSIDIPQDIPKDLLFSQYYSNKDYLENIKKSIFVFNTPAVHDCHGWKLGEFLCMGKAIISTPLKNNLPYPLIDGGNIHLVRNEMDIENAINLLVTDKAFRHKLEENARHYFQQYASPIKVIEQILSK